jgi:hypothetical protein
MFLGSKASEVENQGAPLLLPRANIVLTRYRKRTPPSVTRSMMGSWHALLPYMRCDGMFMRFSSLSRVLQSQSAAVTLHRVERDAIAQNEES